MTIQSMFRDLPKCVDMLHMSPRIELEEFWRIKRDAMGKLEINHLFY